MSNTKLINVADTLSWRVEEKKEDNKGFSIICYRKYLDEALIVAGESKETINRYYEVLKHFKELISHKIETTKSGEYYIKHSKNDVWYHRQKEVILKSYFEFILKRICLKKEVNFIESLKVLLDIKKEHFLSDF